MSTSSSKGKSIRQEIVELSANLAETQARLDQLVERLGDPDEEGLGAWKARCKELDKKHKEAVNGAKWLRAQNQDLERRLEQYQPEVDSALDAREAAFRKLKHARKVIRDLLAERGDMQSPKIGTTSQDAIEEALYDEFQHDNASTSTSSSTSDSDSDKTVRRGPASTATEFDTPPSRQPAALSPPVSIRSSHGSAATSAYAESVFKLSPQASRVSSPSGTWAIHFKKPPGSSTVREGPLAWNQVEKSLKLTPDQVQSLRRQQTSAELKMQVSIMQIGGGTKHTIAFVYDPIFVDHESRQRSYSLEWGKPETNEDIERYISRFKGEDLIFHTFTFPKSENAWFYLGAQQWSVVSLSDFWPLEGKSRIKMIKKLSERTRGEVMEEEVVRQLDNGELKQLCVELTKVGDAKVSLDFAQNVLGLSPSFIEPKHERRPRTEGVKE